MTHVIFMIALFFTAPVLNRSYPFRYLAFMLLFLFLALRYGYGNDYWGYYNIHYLINNGYNAWGSSDVLFKYLNIYIPNFYLFIAVTSLVYIISIGLLIKLNLDKPNYWVATFILLVNPYLFLVHLSSIRQTMAICIFIFAVHYALKKQIVQYIVLIIAAAGMHSSAIILFPVYFLLNKNKLKNAHFIVIFFILIALLLTPLFENLARILLDFFPDHYTSIYFEQGLTNSIRSMLITLFLLIFTFINFNKLEGNEIIIGKLTIVSLFISILTVKVSMLSRIGMYFDVFMIITFTQLLAKIKNPFWKYSMMAMIFSIFLLRYYLFFINPIWIEAYRDYNTIMNR